MNLDFVTQYLTHGDCVPQHVRPLLLLKMDVSHEHSESQAAFAGVIVAGHVLMLLTIVVEVAGICYTARQNG